MSIEAIKEALAGIDQDACSSDESAWWETSGQAEFGAERLQAVIDIVQPLIERLEAAEKDAERYRLIKNYDNPRSPLAICSWEDTGWHGQWVIEHEPDAVIDAAMKEQQ